MSKWTTAFALAQREQPRNFFDFGQVRLKGSTVRFGFPARFDGAALRVTLSNCENPKPYGIGGFTVHVLRGGKTVSSIEIAFPAAEIPAGGTLVSEPAAVDVKYTDTIVLSYFLPDTPCTCSNVFQSVVGDGDLRSEPSFVGQDFESIPLVAAVDLLTEDDCRAIAVFGDSITQMRLWTDFAAERTAALTPGKASFLNLGIGGNRLLRDTHFARSTKVQFFGRAGLTRFEPDTSVLSGVTRIFAALGCNDISQPDDKVKLAPPLSERCTAPELIEGMEKLAEMIRGIGAEPVFCTITPFGGLSSFCEETENIRLAANAHIRESGAYVDFAKAVEDAAKPGWYVPEANSGDNLHPSKAGGKMMADAIPDELLK